MAITLSAERADFIQKIQPVPTRWLPPGQGPSDKIQSALNEDLQSLHQFSTRARFGRNETIFNEGDVARQAYKVISGIVRICKFTLDGRRQIAEFILPGEMLGFMEGAEHGFAAEAATEVVLRAYPRDQIDRLATAKPGVRDRIFALLTENLLAMQRHLLVLGCQSAKERVSSFLLRLAERTNLAPSERLDLPMGRQDIADHLGLTIETVCRALAELRREGSISSPNLHQLILSDVKALRALMNGECFAGDMN